MLYDSSARFAAMLCENGEPKYAVAATHQTTNGANATDANATPALAFRLLRNTNVTNGATSSASGRMSAASPMTIAAAAWRPRCSNSNAPTIIAAQRYVSCDHRRRRLGA